MTSTYKTRHHLRLIAFLFYFSSLTFDGWKNKYFHFVLCQEFKACTLPHYLFEVYKSHGIIITALPLINWETFYWHWMHFQFTLNTLHEAHTLGANSMMWIYIINYTNLKLWTFLLRQLQLILLSVMSNKRDIFIHF